MYFKSLFVLLLVVTIAGTSLVAGAAEPPEVLEKSVSDTLDVWREGRFEQLFDMLAHRGKTSREKFVSTMRDAKFRPACCWQKLESFKVLSEKRTEATVYAKIGIEGISEGDRAVTRDFKLTHQEGVWKMQLADVLSVAGVSGRKNKRVRR